MWGTVLIIIGLILILKKLFFSTETNAELDMIPGSTDSPLWSILTGNAPNPAKFHLFLAEQAKKYGPVMKIPMLNMKPIVFVNDFEGIHQCLVKLGKEVGDRPKDQYRWNFLLKQAGVMGGNPDEKWFLLRKIIHNHLKKFGYGLSHLEIPINNLAEQMFTEFEANCGVPYDPKVTIDNVAMESIIFLTTNQHLPSNHPLVQKMKQYNAKTLQMLSYYAPPMVMLLEFIPWLRNRFCPGYRILLHHEQLEREAWKLLTDMNDGYTDSETIIEALKHHVNSGVITELDARKVTFSLLLAGGAALSITFRSIINILAHHPEVQSTIFSEIQSVVGNQITTLMDRPSMPYTGATLLEVLRYTSVAAFGGPHSTCVDVIIGGYRIPKDTTVMQNLYYLHWNPEFWGDPEVFRPERFLDDNGKVVSPDHPHRKHLMPFGAGTRVCVGEIIARSRLFLWLSMFTQRFSVRPAPGNNTCNICPENCKFESNLSFPAFEIMFQKRE